MVLVPGGQKHRFEGGREAEVMLLREQLVRKGGLEPPRLAAPDPKSGASANSATFAWSWIVYNVQA
jgi:hypothetical protein